MTTLASAPETLPQKPWRRADSPGPGGGNSDLSGQKPSSTIEKEFGDTRTTSYFVNEGNVRFGLFGELFGE
jgi:hypothetical protein